jgi:hypothetical protein
MPSNSPSTLNPTSKAPTLVPIEITVSTGTFTYPYYTFIIDGSVIDISAYDLIPGGHYKFVRQPLVTTHPFFISDNGRVTASSFTISSTKAFNAGIVNGESLEFQLPSDFVGTLTYYCVPHEEMTNTFRILTSSSAQSADVNMF